MRKIQVLSLLLLIVLSVSLLLISCGPNTKTLKIGDLEYEQVDPASLKEDVLKSWYEKAYKEKVSHSINHKEYKYLLISGGEMPTGGYSIELVQAVKEQNGYVFKAVLKTPQPGQQVTQALTYPHILIRIKGDDNVPLRGELDFSAAEAGDNGDESGYNRLYAVFVGQVDNNAIEMVVDPVFSFPEGGKPFTFRLSDNIRNYFQSGGKDQREFKENDIVRFDCIKTKAGQWEVTEIFNTTAKKPIYGPDKGEYVGQIDANSVEININGQPRAFRLSPDLRLQIEKSEPKTGQQVDIKYIKPAVGQEELIYMAQDS